MINYPEPFSMPKCSEQMHAHLCI